MMLVLRNSTRLDLTEIAVILLLKPRRRNSMKHQVGQHKTHIGLMETKTE
jgi:hypothetical protein|tara:strand:+ start:29 stop:178 length:150 start_codon:yes stop_codon:yes gene_type:complete